MTSWLLDTNILSELRRPKPEPRVIDFVSAQPASRLYISVVTFAEIRFGIERLSDSVRRAELNDWLSGQIRPMFTHRVLDVSEAVLLRWRLLMEEGRKIGHTFGQPDLIIAATASVHDLTVVSRDISQYAKARVQHYNPWPE